MSFSERFSTPRFPDQSASERSGGNSRVHRRRSADGASYHSTRKLPAGKSGCAMQSANWGHFAQAVAHAAQEVRFASGSYFIFKFIAVKNDCNFFFLIFILGNDIGTYIDL